MRLSLSWVKELASDQLLASMLIKECECMEEDGEECDADELEDLIRRIEELTEKLCKYRRLVYHSILLTAIHADNSSELYKLRRSDEPAADVFQKCAHLVVLIIKNNPDSVYPKKKVPAPRTEAGCSKDPIK